jgi:transcriptional regulator with XRE-family HTH domain
MTELRAGMSGGDDMDTIQFGERLKSVRKELSLTLEKFGQEIGLSKGQTWEWEQGRHWPSSAFLRKIPLTHRINLNWLLTGEGSMFLDEKQEEVLRLAEQIQQLSPEHRKLIKEYIEVQLHEK